MAQIPPLVIDVLAGEHLQRAHAIGYSEGLRNGLRSREIARARVRLWRRWLIEYGLAASVGLNIVLLVNLWSK